MFSASRLAIARKRRQLTRKALAGAAGISQVTLTRLESGQTGDPSADTIDALAAALKYPTKFFVLGDCGELSANQVNFRSLTSMTARQRDAALAAGTLASLIDGWIVQRFNVPTPDLPDLRDETPSAAAAALRRYWSLGFKPIPNLVRLLEAKGVRIFSLAEDNKTVDAFSCWRDETPYVFLNVFKSSERSRFDTAHELGHLVMHRRDAPGGREIEREADQFASAFLIPREDLTAYLPRVRGLNQIVAAKGRWNVSVAALTRATFDADIVSDWQYRDLCKQLSYKGYRTHEPLSKPREQSLLWKKVLESLWIDRITKQDIGVDLGLPIDEVASLLDGTLGERASTPSRFQNPF